MSEFTVYCVGIFLGFLFGIALCGAGRRMSRNAAREQLDMGDFMKKMDGIYTTTACESTIDEAPGAYKDAQSIIDQIQDTVKVVKRLKPVYNFKAK